MTAIDLSFEETGDGPPLIILHGLFGQGRNWIGIAKALAGDFRVLTVDLRNHGASPWSNEMNYSVMAEDVTTLIRRECDGGPVLVVGHSMGGKTTMVLALTRPDLVERLSVVDIAPVPYDHDFDAHLEAMANMNTGALTRRAEAEAVLLDAVGDIHIASFLARNLKPAEHGEGFEWLINVTAIATHMDEILDFPIFEADDAYEAPALFLAGGTSDYIQSFHQAEIERLFPNADTQIIDDAGHWVHAEKPGEVVGALKGFLAS